MKKLLYKYNNGDYNVQLFEDGTKIRTWDDSIKNPRANFPESIDLKITNKCDLGCEFCHERSTINGKSGNLNAEFLKTLHPGTELALGGGNVFEMMSHGLDDFLLFLKDKNIFPSVTVNQNHLSSDRPYNGESAIDILSRWINNNLVYGIGISYNGDSEHLDNAIATLQKKCNKNVKEKVVIHLINGIHSKENIETLLNKNYKALMLGYKDFGRGQNFYLSHNKNVEKIKNNNYNNIHKLIHGFKVLSFDNLAIEQLALKRIFLKDDWDSFYMGDDGTHTMYIDLVNKEYAVSSTSKNRCKILDNIDDMFQQVMTAS